VVFGRWRDLLGDFVMDVFLVEVLVGVERSIVKSMQYHLVVEWLCKQAVKGLGRSCGGESVDKRG
jgi:hypothetical protein